MEDISVEIRHTGILTAEGRQTDLFEEASKKHWSNRHAGKWNKTSAMCWTACLTWKSPQCIYQASVAQPGEGPRQRGDGYLPQQVTVTGTCQQRGQHQGPAVLSLPWGHGPGVGRSSWSQPPDGEETPGCSPKWCHGHRAWAVPHSARWAPRLCWLKPS